MALANLDRVDYVGIQENLGALADTLFRKLRPKGDNVLPNLNVSDINDTYSDEVIDIIRENNQFDIALYERAKQRAEELTAAS